MGIVRQIGGANKEKKEYSDISSVGQGASYSGTTRETTQSHN
jgi:hypothetical protein